MDVSRGWVGARRPGARGGGARARAVLLGLACALGAGSSCGGGGSPLDAAPAPDDARDAGTDAPATDAPPEGGPVPVGVRLPQAAAGALLANPSTYDVIPLHAEVSGSAESVTFTVDTLVLDATDPEDDGVWTALAPIGDRPDAVLPVHVEASSGGATVTADAELVLRREGAQLTDNTELDFIGTPRLHAVEDRLWLTWTDRSDTKGEAWLREIDGAGRWLGDRIALVGEPDETLYARTAFGGGRLGVLYQKHGVPYQTYFRIVTTAGETEVGPIHLDEAGREGKFGGEVVYDGSGFVVVWRSRSGAAEAVHWARIDDVGLLTGPVVVAESGDDDPHGTFEPFSFVGVATLEGRSLVTFVRGYYAAALESSLPKSQLAAVDASGTLLWSDFLGIATDFTFHREAHVWAIDGSFFVVWTDRDLLASDEPPNMVHALRLAQGESLPGTRGVGHVMVDAIDDNDEPVLVDHPTRAAVLAWLDHRAYTLSTTGGVALYAAPVGDDLAAHDEVLFAHARVFAGLAELRGAAVGSNVVLTWLDTRNSEVGAWEFHPEIWLDTAWF